MSGDYSEVSSQSWFSRLMEAIKGILVGVVLVLISFPLIAWNEYRAVTTAKSLAEGSKALVTVEPDKVDKDNEGKFVHMTGLATTKDTLKDDQFGVSAEKAIHLNRKVEMYQWKENKTEKKKKKLGGGEETTTTYTYTKAWSDKPIDSSAFKKEAKEAREAETKDKLTNPPMPYESKTFTASKVTLGAFMLPAALVSKITKQEPLPITSSGNLPDGFKIVEKGAYKGSKPDSPAIGDLKVNFSETKPEEVSVYGRQFGDTLEPYKTSAGDSLMTLREGKMSGAEMIAQAEGENTTMTWILRLVGFLCMAVGIFLVFRPFVVLADVVPFLGDLLGVGAGVFAVILAVPLTLFTIAVSWIVVRPLLGIGLLAVGAVVLGGGIFLARKIRAGRAPKPATE